jgi:hypothetical protein
MQGQFGKNHLGDRNEYLPTVHGFDGYAGVLYHLNALEEPENVDYPKDPEFFKKIGPRDAIHTWATDEEDKTEDPCFGVVSADSIEAANWLTMLDYRIYFFQMQYLKDQEKRPNQKISAHWMCIFPHWLVLCTQDIDHPLEGSGRRINIAMIWTGQIADRCYRNCYCDN